MSECLLLVDLQNDYFPGGSMELVGADAAAAQAYRLLDAYRAAGRPVVHVRHLASRPGAGFFLPGTPGAEIHPTVFPQGKEPVVVKHFPNSFRGTDLLSLLQGIKSDSLVICGAMSHMCIDATTRAAFDLGFVCTVAEDACATRDLVFKGRTLPAADVHAAFMAALAVPYARIATTDVLLGELAGEKRG